ncbi:MAG: hypothetical protein CVU90_07035 [Firmicutes bacterium HGW-Firmicutes-15]|nr:MAG: hypothetical protein CVU90_07035 [Firmicutes bacterium HGW-Firmicutes-15]
MKVQEYMSHLQEDVFDYNIDTIPNQLSELMTAIIEKPAFDINDLQKIQTFNLLMQSSLQALKNRDYLLLADIIEFELKTFLVI